MPSVDDPWKPAIGDHHWEHTGPTKDRCIQCGLQHWWPDTERPMAGMHGEIWYDDARTLEQDPGCVRNWDKVRDAQ